MLRTTALLAVLVVVLASALDVHGQGCITTLQLDQAASPDNVTWTASYPVTVTDAGLSSLCVNLTLGNVVGLTWSVQLSVPDSSATLLYDLYVLPMASGQSVFMPVDQYNPWPKGREYSTFWTVEGPSNVTLPYTMTVYLRADNADIDTVNNTVIAWDQPLPQPQWFGSVFTADVLPENAKEQCQVFTYDYQLVFPSGPAPTNMTVTTTGVDSARGTISVDTFITAGTAGPVTMHGEITAAQGHFERRLVAVVTPDQQVTAPFSIQVVAVSLVPTDCQNKNNLSTGAIIGIVIGSAIGGILLLVGLALIVAKFSKRDGKGYESFE